MSLVTSLSRPGMPGTCSLITWSYLHCRPCRTLHTRSCPSGGSYEQCPGRARPRSNHPCLREGCGSSAHWTENVVKMTPGIRAARVSRLAAGGGWAAGGADRWAGAQDTGGAPADRWSLSPARRRGTALHWTQRWEPHACAPPGTTGTQQLS
jgi:hypothetical protein